MVILKWYCQECGESICEIHKATHTRDAHFAVSIDKEDNKCRDGLEKVQNLQDHIISSPWSLKVLNCHFTKWQFNTF